MTKSVTRHKAKLRKVCSKSNTRNFKLNFLLEQHRWLPNFEKGEGSYGNVLSKYIFLLISVIATNTDKVMWESTEIAVTVVTLVLIITSIAGDSFVCAVIKKNRDMR